MSNGLAVMLLSVVDDVKEGLEFFPTAVVQVSMYCNEIGKIDRHVPRFRPSPFLHLPLQAKLR